MLFVATFLLSWSLRAAPPLRAPAPPLTAAADRRAVVPLATFEFAFNDEDAEDEEGGQPDDALALTNRPADNLTVAELKHQLVQLGQRPTGKKQELVERVQLMQRKRALGLPLHDMQVQRERGMKWYMLQTANGFERAVERTINMAIKAQHLEESIERVWVPILEGETSVRENSVMPSYIFIKMAMNANLHFLISDMQYVINFVGADRGGRSMSGQMVGNRGFVRPMHVSDAEIEKIVALTRVKPVGVGEEEAEEAAPAFAVDDVVEVREGPFKGLRGPVASVGEGGETLTVTLTVMGTATPVDLPAAQCAREDAREEGD